MSFRPPTLPAGWCSSDQTTQLPQGRRNVSVHSREERAELGDVVVGTQHSSHTRYRVRWRAVLHATFHAYRALPDANERPLRNINTPPPQLFQIHCCVAARIASSCHLARFIRALRAHASMALRLFDRVTPGSLRSSSSCRQCPTPRLASTFECCVHSQLLTAAHVQRLRLKVHFNLPSCRCQRVFLRCTSCELEVSLSNCLVTLGGFTRLEWHLRSAPECVPAEIMVDQQFVQLATARVPFHTCKHALHIVVQARFCNPRPPRHSHISPMPEFLGACSSPSIVSRFQLFGCSPHQQGPISQRTDPRTSLDHPTTPTRVVSSTHSRAQWSKTSNWHWLALRASRTGHH